MHVTLNGMVGCHENISIFNRESPLDGVISNIEIENKVAIQNGEYFPAVHVDLQHLLQAVAALTPENNKLKMLIIKNQGVGQIK